MGKDPFHQPRVLQAPSNLALNTAREGTATASLGNLGQGLTALTVKNFCLISYLNLHSFSLKPSPLVLLLHALVTSPSPSLSQPLQALAAALRCPQSLLLSRLTSPSSPSLSSQQRGSSPSDHCCDPQVGLNQIYVLNQVGAHCVSKPSYTDKPNACCPWHHVPPGIKGIDPFFVNAGDNTSARQTAFSYRTSELCKDLL